MKPRGYWPAEGARGVVEQPRRKVVAIVRRGNLINTIPLARVRARTSWWKDEAHRVKNSHLGPRFRRDERRAWMAGSRPAMTTKNLAGRPRSDGSADPRSSVDQIAMAKSGIRPSGPSRIVKSRSPARSAAKSAGSSPPGGREATSGGNITVVSRDNPEPGKTDWAAIDALTDKEIGTAVCKDRDAVPLDFDWSKAVLIAPAKKKAISIRVDEDILAFFKRGGDGYQGRINAVLRHFMTEQRRKED